jgi:hypothetical protein
MIKDLVIHFPCPGFFGSLQQACCAQYIGMYECQRTGDGPVYMAFGRTMQHSGELILFK